MKFYFHVAAEEELGEAVNYYESCQAGLGLEFAEEVHAEGCDHHNTCGS